jgi:hypothetical protein
MAPSCHRVGTTLAERGVHERVAQYLLGHSDSRTTREIYTHVSDPMMDQAVEAITAAVEEASSEAADTNGSRNGSRAARNNRSPEAWWRGALTWDCGVGTAGFEPATSCSQSRRANQAAPRPVKNGL